MSKLNFQDLSFLLVEAPQHPFHVAALMILKLPPNAPKNYLRKLARSYASLCETWPILQQKLKDPKNLRNASWIKEENFQPERHVLHYALPQPGRMEDFMQLVTRAHERLLDRSRPLWETHIIEGLPRNRFALYCKIHHSLVDGTGGIRLIVRSLLSNSPKDRLARREAMDSENKPEEHHTALQELGEFARGLVQQSRAVPEVYSMLSHIGRDALRGKEDAMTFPFSAPQTLFNTETDSTRRIILCELPFRPLRAIAHRLDGTVNDVLIAVYSGALRSYLISQRALPRKSLIAAVPVSLKSAEEHAGTQVTLFLCPYFTNEADALKRLRRIIKVTTGAKAEFSKMSRTASIDYANLMIAPMTLMSMTGTSNKLPAMANVILSNVVGASEKLYLEGSEVEALYPLSVVMDGHTLNLTVISYDTKLCFGITCCPTLLPGIEGFDDLLKQSFRDLQEAVKAAA